MGLNREAVKLYCDDNVFKYIQITEETTALELVYIGLDQVKPIVHISNTYCKVVTRILSHICSFIDVPG